MQETTAFDAEWHGKVANYEAGVAAQLTALRAAHEAQMADFLLQSEVIRPAKPQHSAQYLNNRKIEEMLVKQVNIATAHSLLYLLQYRCSKHGGNSLNIVILYYVYVLRAAHHAKACMALTGSTIEATYSHSAPHLSLLPITIRASTERLMR